MPHLKDGPDHYTTAFSVSPDHSGEGYLGPRGYYIRGCESASRIFMLKSTSSSSQVNDALVDVPEFPPGAKGILWENWPLDKVCRSSVSWEEEVPTAFIVPTLLIHVLGSWY